MANLSSLKVSRTRSGYCIRVEGRGTLRESPTVHAFARHVLDSEPAAVVIDLSACDHLDSTFLGCLIDLHRRYGALRPPRFSLAAPAEARKRLLAPSGLDALFHYLEDRPELIGEDVELSPLSLQREELGKHVLECHRRLVELGGPVGAAYQGIVDRLAEELVRH
jgi:anti-anti-sigma regulatory factor